MTITVVVPVHNGAATLADTLTSLERQTVPPAQVIVIDDGSTDASADIATSHPLQPKVIRLGLNRGVAFARNTGLLEATTDYVAFLDQDDMWLPWRTERLQNAVEAFGGVVVTEEQVFAAAEDRDALRDHPFLSWVEHWRPRAQATDLLSEIDGTAHDSAPTTITPQRLISGSVTKTTSYALPRRLALQVGGFAAWARGADDWILLQVLAAHTPITHIDEPSVLYRVHPANTSTALDWPLPLLVSAAGVRFGGGLVSGAEVHDAERVGRVSESNILMHHLLMGISTAGGRRDALAAWQLLATDRNDQLTSGRRMARAALTSTTVGRQLQTMVRGVRARRGVTHE